MPVCHSPSALLIVFNDNKYNRKSGFARHIPLYQFIIDLLIYTLASAGPLPEYRFYYSTECSVHSVFIRRNVLQQLVYKLFAFAFST